MGSPPLVSVVIPTLNAADSIEALLSALFSQTLAPMEVLVIDSSSDDATPDIARRCGATVTSIPRESFDHGRTRHEAFLASSGDVVCYLTQDALPADTELLSKLVAPLRDPSVGMCWGRQVPRSDARRFEQLMRTFRYPEESFARTSADVSSLGIRAFSASNVCAAYRRDAYLKAGGFERPLATSEDMLMAARMLSAGYAIAYVGDARVYHSHKLTLREQFARNRAAGDFLQTYADELHGADELGEGWRVVSKVALTLVKEGRPLELLTFCVDCAARLLGNRRGRHDASVRQRCAERASARLGVGEG